MDQSVTLFLLGEKGYVVFEYIVKNNLLYVIDQIVIGKDRNVRDDFSNKIEELAKQNNVNTFNRSEIEAVHFKTCIAIGWRWLISNQSSMVIVVHDSLLPKYRGFAPLVNQLINAEKTIGVTALIANEEFDKGDIIGQQKIDINYPIKIQEAISKLSILYGKLVVKILNDLITTKNLLRIKQNEQEATYSLWRDQEDYWIDWSKSSNRIQRFINAVGSPYDGAKCILNDHIITIHECSIVEDVYIENRDVGKVLFMIQGKPIIVCGEGLIKLEDATYLESKKSIFPLKNFRIRFKNK